MDVKNTIYEYINRAEEFKDMSELRSQADQINNDWDIWELKVQDFISESLVELITKEYGIGSIPCEFNVL